MFKKLTNRLNNDRVFYISLLFVAFILCFALFNMSGFESTFNNIQDFLVNNFYWFYNIVMIAFFIFCLVVGLSKFGKIRLGKDTDKPKYSFLSWFTMLFSAGMGIGLIFWGVAEPLSQYVAPMGVEPFTQGAKEFAMRKTFLHWGISAWACYAVLALALAYVQFRKNKPALVSSLLIPIIGEKKARGWIGNVVDIFTLFATVAGIITSLGLGTLQINAGLNYLFDIPENKFVQVLIILTVTVCFMISATTGLDKGIQKLSNINMSIAAVLLIISIIIGPTFLIFKNFFIGVIGYAKELLVDNNNIFKTGPWYKDWTIFYWGWWIAWAPPVGIFIARISKGRTIREFLLGVMLAPSLLCLVWFSTFGTIGFNVANNIATKAVATTETAFFVVMNNYPYGFLISFVAVILLATFFVTSADSATFVLAMLSSKGNLNPKNTKKIAWGIIQATLTITFLFAGGLQMIQTVSIVAAFPFAFIMIMAMVSLGKYLKTESAILPVENKVKIKETKYKPKENLASFNVKNSEI